MAISTGTVPTATGDIVVTELGRTLIHERTFAGLEGWQLLGETEAEAPTVAGVAMAFEELRRLDIDAIVDVATPGCGQRLDLLAEASRRSGLRIVCVTGVDAAAGIPMALRALSPEAFAGVLIRDLTEGIAGSGTRAGAIVLAPGQDHGVSDWSVLAAAFAHAETGAPIIARAEAGETVALARALMARGVDPSHVVAAHADAEDRTLASLEELGALGVRLGFTHIGHAGAVSDDLRSLLVAQMARKHGSSRVCLGTNAVGHLWAARLHPDRERNRIGFSAFEGFTSRLRSAGLDDEALDAMLTESVRSLFAASAR